MMFIIHILLSLPKELMINNHYFLRRIYYKNIRSYGCLHVIKYPIGVSKNRKIFFQTTSLLFTWLLCRHFTLSVFTTWHVRIPERLSRRELCTLHSKIPWKMHVFLLQRSIQNVWCQRDQLSRVTVIPSLKRSGSFGVKHHLFPLFAWCDMAFSWFTGQKLSCNWFAFLLAKCNDPCCW